MTLLETRDLQVHIGTTRVCSGLQLRLAAGERWCILGRNGAGKTTLLHTLAGLRRPAHGEVLFDGRPLHRHAPRRLAQHIGLLPQDHTDAFPATVMETVLSGRHPWIGPLQWESDDDRAVARQALADVGLEDFSERLVSTLSGGERRRVGLATLLAQDTPLALLDEPTNHLDIHHQIGMLALLRARTGRDGHGLLLVMHDLNLAQRYCSHFLLLFGDGDTLQGSADETLTAANLERLYRHPLQPLDTPQGTVWLPR